MLLDKSVISCCDKARFQTPKSISASHFNETYSRIAIESATSLLHVQDPVKTRIEKNLKPFAQKTGNSWVLNVLK